jgi:hypothetical protein
MKAKPETASRFPALDALCEEFLRVARESPRPRRLHLRRVALALALTVIVVPVGLALAQDAEPTGAVPGNTTADVGPSAVALSHPCEVRSELPPGVTLRPELAELCATRIREARMNRLGVGLDPTQKPKDVAAIGSASPPAALVQECRADPNAEGLCGVVLAQADGKLPPGNYTDAQLQAAVRAAGYEWSPSD